MSSDSPAGSGQLEQALRRAAGTGSGKAGPPARISREAAGAAERFARIAADRGLVDITYASVDSPFGPMLAASTGRGLVRLAFPEESVESVLESVARRLSPRILHAPERLDPLRRELDQYFAGRRRSFRAELDWSLIGPFGRRVLAVTAAIPYGGVLSYAEVAGEAGSPRGSRAAGNALGANPIPIVIPCHRVLRTGGALGGYGGGIDRKRWLLELEGALEPAAG
ncbi:MAG: methylated-DNA--[protein]-cysteine S-methyltransferase [Solirubrobacteraceae bacterium]